jgi:IS5 family transposase
MLRARATPAKSSDTCALDALVQTSRLPEKSRVYADTGYTSVKNCNILNEKQLQRRHIVRIATSH